MNHYLGLDLSLLNSGAIILEEGGSVACLGSAGSKPQGDRIPERFCRYENIRAMIKKVVVQYNTMISCIAIEAYSYASPGRSIEAVENGTLIREMLLKQCPDALFLEVSPQSLKKYIIGGLSIPKGTDTKPIILKEVYKRYNQDFNDHNLADAFILAHIARTIYHLSQGFDVGLTTFQKETIDKLMKGHRIENIAKEGK